MFAEYLPAFLADFGVDCHINGQAVRGLFDNQYITAAPLASAAGLSASAPALTVPTADIPADPVGAMVYGLDGEDWRFIEHQPDGTGMSVLLLERVL